MNKHQVSIAAESFAASLLAQAGCDVLVQYGANQPHYDLVAVNSAGILKISVKGSSDGGWMLAQKVKDLTYHECIERWREKHGDGLVFAFVQYLGIPFGTAPRAYLATTAEVATRLKSQHNGKGCMYLIEDYQRDHPRSQYKDVIPEAWTFTRERLAQITDRTAAANP
jgi:hypothetical protein